MMKPRSRARTFVKGFLFLLALVAVFLIGRLMGMRIDVDDGATDPMDPVVTSNDKIEDPKDDDAIPYGDDALGMTELKVDWATSDVGEPVDAKFLAAVKDRLYTGNGTTQKNASIMYKLGTVTGEAYAGDTLYFIVLEVQGLGIQYEYYYVLADYGSSGQVTLINRTAGLGGLYNAKAYTAEDLLGDAVAAFVDVKNATPVQMGTVVTIDKEIYIPEFGQTPGGVVSEVKLIDGKTRSYVTLGVGERLSEIPAPSTSVATLSNFSGELLYLSEEQKGKNLFFTIREDMRAVWYDVVIPFWKPAEGEQSAVPAITWADGSINTESYAKGAVGGCGFTTLTNVVDKEELGTLIPMGTASTGENIYAQQNTNSDRLSTAFVAWAIQHRDKTYTDFLAARPFFYYRDSFDRLIEFTNTQVMPAGECGKPVIYLYPETTQDLTVQLAPQGGFTKTEPAYGNGWNVTATPEGVLTNAADGKTYPYLFWEGRGGLYEAPKDYWVVAKKDVPSFLTSTLGKLGLNQKEIADFEEFWLPRMASANYYKIGFHGTSVMNQIAPMTISQKPETLIRVLMDYAPMTVPESENPPILPKTPARKGFTVVEWGGVIR